MGFQFIREECYARIRSQGAPTGRNGKDRSSPGKLSAREVIAEAVRAAGSVPHIGSPQTPRCLYGMEPDDLPLWLEQIEAMSLDVKVRTAKGERRQRSDTPILMGVVASYPAPADDGNPLYLAWRERTINFFKQRYGPALVSVLEHTDEPFGHLHAEVANRGMSVKSIHAGHSSMSAAAKRGDSKKAQSEAYKSGTRTLQDEFFNAVGMASGLSRIGPRKVRQTRAAWYAEKKRNNAIAAALLQAEQRICEADVKISEGKALLFSAEAATQRSIQACNAEVAERQKSLSEWDDIKQAKRLNKETENKLKAQLNVSNVVKLKRENERLQNHVNLLSGMVTEAQDIPRSGEHQIGRRQEIFQKP